MKNYKLVHRKPFFPRYFGKKHKPRKKHDFGAIFEAAFIVLLAALFLFACFRGFKI